MMSSTAKKVALSFYGCIPTRERVIEEMASPLLIIHLDPSILLILTIKFLVRGKKTLAICESKVWKTTGITYASLHGSCCLAHASASTIL